MHKDNIIKLFNKFAYKYSIYDAYSDFIEIAALSINSAAEINNIKENDKAFQNIVKKYSKDDFEIFVKIFTELVLALEENTTDVLGTIFMEMGLGSKWKGQFFTSFDVCMIMAQITFNDKEINEKGYITLNEPCVGGGAMVLAFSEVMKRKGYNPQTQLKAVCQDLDIRACYMSYIQLSLLGIPAVVYQGNTLMLEFNKALYTPMWILGGWDYKKGGNENEK